MKYLEIEPARAKARAPDKLWDDPEWIAEEKLDGWRFLMHVGRDLPRVYLTGRRTSTTTGKLSEKGECVPPLWPTESQIAQVDYTVLDGEIMSPAGFRDIAGIMNVEPYKAHRRIEEIGCPTYHVFDMIHCDGENIRHLSLLERRAKLKSMLEFFDHPGITMVKQDQQRLAYYDDIVDRGGEGVVLKNVLGTYGENWVKVKRYSTLDVVITRFTEAKFGRTGKYSGLIGAAYVGVYDSNGAMLEVGKVSGMTDDLRRDMSANQNKWIGTVIEIRANGFAKEKLWHPRFARARPDANRKQATFAKMMEDLKLAGERPDPQMELALF